MSLLHKRLRSLSPLLLTIFLLFFLLPFSNAKGNNTDVGIKWLTFQEALKKQKTNPKKIFVDVYTSWCGWCKVMDKQTFTNPLIIDYINEHYYAVKFDAESPEPITFNGKEYKNPDYVPNKQGRNGIHELTYVIANVNGKIAFPTIVFIGEDLSVLSPVQSYLRPAQLEPILKFFGENAHKRMSWNDYQKTFESEIKEESSN